MFLMIGINNGEDILCYDKAFRCPHCGTVKNCTVYMTFVQLLLFFIPTVKWGKRYYVQCSDCGTVYELDPTVGKRLARGEDVEILPEDLGKAQGAEPFGAAGRHRKQCPNCGFVTDEDYEYCPHCRTKLQ